MDSAATAWWRRHGWTIAILLVAFGVAFFLRTAWAYPVIERWGPLYTYAGGSDSYYHSRVMTYIIQTGHNLVYDPMLKYPVGSVNPREPLFDWMNAVLGIVFSPFFGGNSVVAGAWFLDLQPPLWAALEVFPIYLIGREVSGRRTGLIGALIYPFLTSSINSSTFGYANYLSFYTFVLLVVIYSFLRLLKTTGHRRYVEHYRQPREFVAGLRSFFAQEPLTVKWAVFTGVALGALALSWQGYTYGIVVIGISLLVAMIIERIRKVDSFSMYVSTWIVGLVAFPMLAPYYLVQHEFTVFLVVPVLLFFGILLVLLPFLLMRDVPWVFSIPALVGIVAAAVVGLRFLSPGQFQSIVTGQGYFVKNLIYTTVAEAQAPSIDQLVVGFGVVTFFLAFVGIALCVWLLVQHRFKRHHIAFLVYAVVSIYLPVSATKFFLVGTPIFALLAAEAVHRALDVGGYPELRRTVASLSDTRGQFAAFRKAFKARHVLVLALVLALILPNMWLAIDAGIPGNTKTAAAEQINATIPSWLKLNRSSPGANYLGEAGSSLDTPNQYDSAAYNWLAGQDTNVPEPNRPAFVSWWDYGFQAIDQGQHPSVADNFQNGIDPAGQFLLSQNESLGIAILATTLLQGEILQSHLPDLPGALNTILAGDGVNVTVLHQLLNDQAADYTMVVRDPAKYLPVNPSTISDDNAMYLAVSYYLAGHLSTAGVAKLYDDIQSYTGWTIRYAMTDSRLFPFTGSATGIFYAPADLTGRVINSAGVPTTFYNVTILGSDGNTYPLGPLPAGVTASNYNINWSAPFYNSMLYKIYIGYNGTQVGLAGGIPGLSGAAAGQSIEPGFMLQHFEAVYRTAYVCPDSTRANATGGCYRPVNFPDAASVANRTKGVADTNASTYFQGGETMLAYYPGETLLGRVVLPDGVPVAGVRATIYDGWKIPHMSVLTAADGTFSLVLPPGNDTLNLTMGSYVAQQQADSNLLASVRLNVSSAVGYSLSAPTLTRTFQMAGGTVNGQVYYNLANNSSFQPGTDVVLPSAKVVLTGLGGQPTLTAVTDPSGTFSLTNVPPQVYNVSVRVGGQKYTGGNENVTQGSVVNASIGVSPGQVSGKVATSNGTAYANAIVVVRNATSVVATTASRSSGDYLLRQLLPGNYTAEATVPGTTIRSAISPFRIATPGGSATLNLTVASLGTVSVALSYAGSAASNVAVRFVPEVGLANGSFSPIATLTVASSSSVGATSGPTGIASASLPAGPYSVYALGTIGGVRVSAVDSVTVLAGVGIGPLALTLLPAVTVLATVTGPLGFGNSSTGAVVAYGANASEVVGWTGANATATLWLPPGSYSLAAAFGTTTTGSQSLAGLVRANVSGSLRAVSIPLTNGVTTHFAVGSTSAQGAFFGAVGASVVVSAGATGPSVRMTSGPGGATGLLLPAVAPSSTQGYCVNVTAFGFSSNATCGWTAGRLANLSVYPMTLTPVNVSLEVKGLPTGTPVTVTFAAETSTAVDRTLVGGPRFALFLPPGGYGVGAKAVIGNGTTVYLPPGVQSTTIPLGATYSNLTLTLVPEINATGTLALPSGANRNTTLVNLSSALFSTSVNATNFTHGFRASPGNYTATVTATVGSSHYVNISRVVVAANGTVTPKLVLDKTGLTLSGILERPDAAILTVSANVTLVGDAGIPVVAPVHAGTFHVTLPKSLYSVAVNTSTVESGPNGSFVENWTNAPNATCQALTAPATCRLVLVGSVPTVAVSGALLQSGTVLPTSGTVRLVGPYPATNVTSVPVAAGRFSASLAPGSYYAYAVANGSGLAGFARILAFAGAGPATVALQPAWTVTVGLSSGAGTSVPSGAARLIVKDLWGNQTIFPSAPLGTSVVLELPLGTYTLSAYAPGALNGVAGNASANVTVNVVGGNLGPALALAVAPLATVAASIVGSSNVTVAAGGFVSFPISVRANGNVPVTVSPSGSPSSWNFSFNFANVSLVPGGPAFSGEVIIGVPPGTAVNHAPVAITFTTSSGSVAGSVSPAPTVEVGSYFGVKVAATTTPPSVGEASVRVPFYLRNTGNSYEQVQLIVADTGRLAGIGWTPTLEIGTAAVHHSQVNLTVGANETGAVNLSSSGGVVVAPGSVTLQALVINATTTVSSSVTLSIPSVRLTSAPGQTSVSGPSVGPSPSSTPTWLVPLLSFVPAIALVVGLFARRWWKTRRWTRR